MHTPRKVVLLTFFLVIILSMFFLAACSGRTLINVNIDPTTGSGNIVVNPPAAQPTTAPAGTSTGMSQVALFAIVVILLLGVMAIIFSVARRPRQEE